ncbi:alpha/beta hydrolase fold-3 domain-containing protein [Xylariomycetidae sp. FL0641]|nr:alpha/beta hydrolase fold-3 domain-containing protein [Xylariomycetidae sp. FL0641]
MSSAQNHPLISYQPLRLLFQLSYLVTTIACLPYYAVISLVPAFRPNPRWSAKQTFTTRLLYRILDCTSRVSITEDLTLEPRKEGDRFQVIAPAGPEAYEGRLAHEFVTPAVIGGTWFPRAPAGALSASATVFLYFHGGAFIQGDGRDRQCGGIAGKLLARGGAAAVFSVQYRLSGCGGRDPFPAAVQDALSAYLHLLRAARVPAERIVVAGDSAGTNLAVALLRHLAEHVPGPPPRCAVLVSPWVAPFHFRVDGNPRRGTDFVPASFARWGARAYAGGHTWAADDPYITPLGHPFPTPVPIFASAGSAELSFEHIARWADEMRAVKGNKVELFCEKDAVHDTLLIGEVLGFDESAWKVAASIGEFVRKCR